MRIGPLEILLTALIVYYPIIFIIGYIVYKDARTKMSFPKKQSIIWALITVLLFPIGPVFYLLAGRKKESKELQR